MRLTFETRYVVLFDKNGRVVGKYESPEGSDRTVIAHDDRTFVDSRDEFKSFDAPPDSFPS